MVEKPSTTQFMGLLEAGGLPELGPGPRPGILSHNELMQSLDPLLQAADLSTVSKDLVRGLILLWHDRLDAAHEIAQGIESADGSFLHGMLHRREPDYGNATYWFRRVGGHPAYEEIASRTDVLLKSKARQAIRDKLLPDGEWDPFAFIGLCEKATKTKTSQDFINTLREVQGIESEVLLERFLTEQ